MYFTAPSGQRIDYTLTPADVPQVLVLFIHGWTSSRASMEPYVGELAKIGITSMAIDMRGHGTSPGSMGLSSRREYLNDLVSAYDTLSALHPELPVHIVGSSFGGYLAACLTEERVAASLVLRAPANYADVDFDVSPPMTTGWAPGMMTRASHAIADAKYPYLVVESGADVVIPHEMIQDYVDLDPARSKHVVLDEALHNLGSSPRHQKMYLAELQRWFTNV